MAGEEAFLNVLGLRYRVPYASNILKVRTDFRELVLDLSVANWWEDTCVD